MNAGEMTLIRVRREIEAELEQLRNLLAEYRDTPKGGVGYLRRAQGSMFHDFYNGVERIFLRISAELGGVPRGEQWHRQLLDDMALDLDDLRPTVISAGLRSNLQRFLRFRHLFRNIYGHELDPDRLAEIAGTYERVHDQFQKELGDFLAWIRAQESRTDPS
ncbi:MAG: hypothetical protein OXJ90_02970 [Spirochaetaceae bacterium]|nr:hypothetical protein [Spirochaetaceae bacterium]